MSATPLTKAELVARLCADRGINADKTAPRLPPRVNILQLDNLTIIRELGAKNTEVWELWEEEVAA